MDQGVTWYECRPRPRPHCYMGIQLLPIRGTTPKFSAYVYCGHPYRDMLLYSYSHLFMQSRYYPGTTVVAFLRVGERYWHRSTKWHDSTRLDRCHALWRPMAGESRPGYTTYCLARRTALTAYTTTLPHCQHRRQLSRLHIHVQSRAVSTRLWLQLVHQSNPWKPCYASSASQSQVYLL